MKEPLGGVPPLGSLRVGSLSVLAELTKSEVYRRRIWSLNIVPKLCSLFTKRMGYLLKFAPHRSVSIEILVYNFGLIFHVSFPTCQTVFLLKIMPIVNAK